MNRNRRLIGLAVAALTVVSSAVVIMTGSSGGKAASAPVVRFWKAPPGKPYWRDDGFGPYAASWPVYAVIVRYAPDASGVEHVAAMTDSTLFLMSGPRLTESNLLESLPSTARFATDCHSDARLRWVCFGTDPAYARLVLVEATGGSCGDRVRIFDHAVAYDSPHVDDSAFQHHTFSEEFTRGCINSPLIADVDGDGLPELLVNELLRWGDSHATSEYGYRIIKLTENGFAVAGDLDEARLKSIGHVEKL
ncbi:hypothetical protein GC176_08900 [bacterium]|nr:hypothetical protein [bacterium]